MVATLLALLALSLAVIAHEFGHFIVGRGFGVGVDRFSVGIGKPLAKYVIGHTEFRFSPFFFGGYCRFVDKANVKLYDADAIEKLRTENPKLLAIIENPEYWLSRKGLFAKIAISIAGPIGSFAFGIIGIALYLFLGGQQVELKPATIATVEVGSPAEEIGFQLGDQLLQINGVDLSLPVEEQAREFERIYAGERTEVVKNKVLVQRGEKEELLEWMKPADEPRAPLESLGLTFATKRITYGPLESLDRASKFTYDIIIQNLLFFPRLFTDKDAFSQVSGPVGIIRSLSASASDSLLNLLYTMGYFSIAIGIINLLPIPGLDGGRILTSTINTLIGDPYGPKIEMAATVVGVLFVVSLLLAATVNDIIKLL